MTPMKKLIAQEMSKELNSRSSPPNLVAKLMGLDTLPQQEHEHPTRSHSETPMSNWDQEDRFFQYRDVYDVWEQPQKVRHNDKMMSLVCQKFAEAKRLSMDGGLHQSKQFQDALDVLSWNKDLFIKCLEEPNSLFSRQLCNLHSIPPPPPDTKRITVLRPSKMVDLSEGKKQIKKVASENISLNSPTRIVVLKPSPDKVLDDNSVTSPQSQSTRIIHGEEDMEIDYPASNLSDLESASYSPESSVGREAKKRLSERWALMTSNGSREHRCLRRSSSTLGEMLALSEAKKETPPPNEQKVSKKELKDSVLVSSSHFGTRLNAENNSVLVEGKLEIPEDTKSKSVKLSFRGKVSSLFFSRNKKSSNDKSIGSETSDEFTSDGTENLLGKLPYYMSSGMLELSNEASLSSVISKQDVISPEGQFSVSSGNPGETQNLPSPVSVLGPLLELYEHTAKVYPRLQLDQYGSKLSHFCIGSSLIDKSPPIRSIARTLSWDDSKTDTSPSLPSTREESTCQETRNEEKEWYLFAKTLLSVAGFEGEEVQFSRWHSPESPLDPSLRENYVTKKPFEAKPRQRQSMQKLVFDCVNAALVQLGETGPVLEEVWARMNGWFSGGCGEETGQVVERVVRVEVAGNGWVENMRSERGILGNEFEGDLVEELLEEAVVELTGRL